MIRKRFLPSLIALAALVHSGFAQAQTVDELITDRPDFTESPVVIPLHQIQVEAGVTWEQSSSTDVVVGPEALIRWAPARRLELRFGVPNYVETSGVSGLSDASVGAKIGLGESGGWKTAAIVGATLPTGKNGLSGQTVDPSLLLTAGRDLPGPWSVGVQASGVLLRDADEFVFASTLVFGRGVSDDVGLFAEMALELPEGGDAAVVIHHGYTFSVGPLMQLDVHGGLGVTSSAPDAFVGAGWSARF